MNTITLTDHEWGMLLSCDQNGFFPDISVEQEHVQSMIDKGLFRRNRLPASEPWATAVVLTPLARQFIGEHATLEVEGDESKN